MPSPLQTNPPQAVNPLLPLLCIRGLQDNPKISFILRSEHDRIVLGLDGLERDLAMLPTQRGLSRIKTFYAEGAYRSIRAYR